MQTSLLLLLLLLLFEILLSLLFCAACVCVCACVCFGYLKFPHVATTRSAALSRRLCFSLSCGLRLIHFRFRFQFESSVRRHWQQLPAPPAPTNYFYSAQRTQLPFPTYFHRSSQLDNVFWLVVHLIRVKSEEKQSRFNCNTRKCIINASETRASRPLALKN